jgi:hypothetical protein
MKILKDYKQSIFGIRYSLFAIVHDNRRKKYCYYVNAIGSTNIGDCCFFRSSKKAIFMNKTTLSILGLFYTLYVYSIKWPIVIISAPFLLYFDGCRNFIKDGAWQNNVRFFNWANIVFVIALLLALALVACSM